MTFNSFTSAPVHFLPDTPESGGAMPPASGGTAQATAGTPPTGGGTQPAPFLVGPDGQFAPDFWNNPLIPEDARIDYVKAMPDLPTALKTLAHQHKMIGIDKIAKPNERWTPEQWAEFNKAVGVPESPDKYAIAKPDKLPQGMNYDEAMEKSYREAAHKLGLRPAQAAELANWFNAQKAEAYTAEMKTFEEQQKAEAEKLAKDWGNKREVNTQRAKLAANTFLTDPQQRQIVMDAIGKDYVLSNLLAAVGSQISEDKLIGITPDTLGGAASARGELAKIMADPAYLDSRHPQHDGLVQRAFRLQQIITGEVQ